MKILFTAGAFYPDNHGGPSYSIYWLAKALVPKCKHVSVLTTNHGLEKRYPTNRNVDVEGIETYYCSKTINKFPLRMIIKGICKIPKFEIIHLSSVCFIPSFFFALWAKILRKKVIWSPRGEFASEAIAKNRMKLLYFKLIKMLFKNNITFHSTSEKETKEIEQIISAKNIISLPNYSELCGCEKYHPKEMYLLYVGRINKIKAIHKLIRGLSMSEKFKSSNSKLKIAGDLTTFPKYSEEIKELISELNLSNRIEFLGRIDGKDKMQLYANAYFSFLVSESENFGNVVVESMSQGTPVVTSLGTPWAVLQLNNLGFHIDNSPLSLSKVIDEIFNLDQSDYINLRERVKEFCWDNYSIQRNLNKWFSVYNNL